MYGWVRRRKGALAHQSDRPWFLIMPVGLEMICSAAHGQLAAAAGKSARAHRAKVLTARFEISDLLLRLRVGEAIARL